MFDLSLKGRVFTIPLGKCFVSALAKDLIHVFPTLMDRSIQNPCPYSLLFLPNNRGVLNFKQAFYYPDDRRQSARPLMTDVKIFPLADLEKGLAAFLNPEDTENLPHTLTYLQRLSWVMEQLPSYFSSQKKIALGHYLCDLHDQCTIAEIPLSNLGALLETDRLSTVAGHIVDAVHYLKIITEQLPAYQHDHNVITAAERSIHIHRLITTRLIQAPSLGYPLIIAGTTGTVPATRRLIQAVLSHDLGAVILPGFDCPQGLDVDGYGERVLSMPTHPHYSMMDLCHHLKIPLQTIHLLDSDPKKTRLPLLRAMFTCPPITPVCDDDLLNPPLMIECESMDEEARVIRVIVQEQLDTTTDSIAIVTPNQDLTERIRLELLRCQIIPNLSAGQALKMTPVGSFVCVMADFLKNPNRETFVHLMKHPLTLGKERALYTECIQSHEILIRQKKLPWYAVAEEGITAPLMEGDRVEGDQNVTLSPLIDRLQTMLTDRRQCKTFHGFVSFFKDAAILLSGHTLFDHEAGAVAKDWFHMLCSECPGAILNHFEDALVLMMDLAEPVHFDESVTSRVRILGTLEARLNRADSVICASLNEGHWPKTPESDPYLSNGLRQMIGLVSNKRQQGLAAHDFCVSFYAKKFFVTRSVRSDGEVLAPSRLWTRLLMAAPQSLSKQDDYRARAQLNGARLALSPMTPPFPSPPSLFRPTTYYASHIEQLVQNPYGFYTRHILKLEPLLALKETQDARDKGKLFHNILDRYLKEEPTPTVDRLIAFAKPYFHHHGFDTDDLMKQTFWWHRFSNIAKWWHEKLDTEPSIKRMTEVTGQINLEINSVPFVIKSRADRLDIPLSGTEDGVSLRLIDYKTGQLPSMTAVRSGKAPQLLVEAIIAHYYGFFALQRRDRSNHSAFHTGQFSCEYWRLTGGVPAGECLNFVLSADDRMGHEKALRSLLAYFYDEKSPYIFIDGSKEDVAFVRKEEWA